MRVEVVDNPRRKKRRRMTAKQRKYFGPRKARRRRNPALATLANPRRRTRRRARRAVRGYVVRRRRRNPGLLGFKGFDFRLSAMVGIGICSSEVIPNMVRKFWPVLPTAGPMGYAVKAGATVATAFAVQMVTKKKSDFEAVIAGGFGSILVGVFNEYVMPMLPGLNGLAGNGVYVYPEQLNDVTGMGRYVSTGQGMGRYLDTTLPEGSY